MKKLLLLITLGIGALEAHDNREVSDLFNDFNHASHPSFMSITADQRDRLLDLYGKFTHDLRELVEKIAAENQATTAPLQFQTILRVLAESDTVVANDSKIFHFSLSSRDEQSVDEPINID